MSCSSGASKVFTWFQNLTTISTLFSWVSICIAYIQFHKALKAQGIDRSTLVFRSPFQPYTAWFALIFFSIIILFNGFYVFSPWSVDDFITAYIGVPIYFGLYIFWKIFKRSRWVSPYHADIHTGKAAMDAADSLWPERKPKNIIEKIWYFIA